MTDRSLFLLFLISACCCCLNAQNLIVNPGFENTTQDADKPDYWHPRSTTLAYHHIETNSANVYAGSKCVKFNNTSASVQNCYYYSNYSITGATTNFPNVSSGEVYEFSIKYKTDSAFTGTGISIQLFLCDGVNIVGNYNTEYITSPGAWSTLKIRGTVQGTVNKIAAGVNYSGKGIAWVDEAQLIKISSPLCKNGSFETDIASPTDKPDYYMPRSTTSTYHHVETSFLNTYLGYNASLFNNTGAATACYYYGPYNAGGTASDYIAVCPGDSYSISGQGRTDAAFAGNDGVRLSIIFWNNSTYVSRADSAYTKSTAWTKIAQDGTVPAGANKMSYSVEYNGQNKAWVDEVRLLPKNLVKNSSFETDASPADKADYWYPKSDTLSYHHVDASAYYEGSKSAMFNNTGGTAAACYYYGPSDAASSSAQLMDVVPGEIYTFSAYGKVDTEFSGTGLMVSILFYNDGTYVSRTDSSWTVPASWTQKTVTATVPATGVNKICYSIEYNGKGKAWFDRATLSKTDPWYYVAAPVNSLESLTFTPLSKVAYATMQNKFYAYHAQMELYYNGDGSWNNGYGVVTADYPNGHPLLRASSNAVIGYLHAYNKIGSSYQATASARSLAALNWLVSQQNANGSFSWWNANPPTTMGGPEMYETGLAGAALIKGYEFFGTQGYLDASNAACDYLVTCVPSANANANFNAFAIMALVANYKHTATQAYLDQALTYMNTILSFQLDSGMWADTHNEYIYYHGVIVQSMVELIDVMPDSNPKKEVIRQALYKALNHTRRSQSHSPYQTAGALLQHPINLGIWYCPSTTMAVTEAYSLLGMSSLNDSMDTLTAGAQWIVKDTVQAFGLAALGIMLDYYY